MATIIVDLIETNRYVFDIPDEEVPAFQQDSREWLAAHNWTDMADVDVLSEEVEAISAYTDDDKPILL